MIRKIRKVLVVLGISGVTLFQANGCDTFMQEFVKGFNLGYSSQTGEEFFTPCSDGSYGILGECPSGD
ncbi:MAG: hypothetical protein KA354_13770 [Phycisphaerae bacterium]|nr:hypothetical protein [Phycisphaerae bacterium]